MIDLYTWPTPNGHKIHIMLEETGLAYNVIPINIGEGDQFTPEFLRVSPNNKMPAMVDHDGPDGEPITLAESGAMLIYLGEKTGRFYPSGARARHVVNQWLMTQMGHVGPMLGQVHHFRNYAPEKIPYAIDRYVNEGKRLYNVLDRRLDEAEWLGGPNTPSRTWRPSRGSASTRTRGSTSATTRTSSAGWTPSPPGRPWSAGSRCSPTAAGPAPMDEKTKEMLFGSTQYERR